MRFRLFACIAFLALYAPAAAGEASVTLPRAGQIGVGLQGQFGTLLSSGNLGDAFDSGGGYAIRVRYRMRYARALGLSFESQNFDAAVASDADTAFRSLRLVTSGVELYQFSDPRQRTQRYMCVGVGLYQSSIKQVNKEIFYLLEPDGLYAGAGAGLERFFWRNWALELSGRYLAVFNQGNANHNFQASAGLVFYASY